MDSYVEELRQKRAARSPDVLRALRRVERHRFVSRLYHYDATNVLHEESVDPLDPGDDLLERILSDQNLSIWAENGRIVSTISQPSAVASMLEQLSLKPGLRVLEVGAGTGYNAALIADIVGPEGSVVTVEICRGLADHTQEVLREQGFTTVTVEHGDGQYGAAAHAPFDRIIVTAAWPDLSPWWLEQLRADGVIVFPLAQGLDSDVMMRVCRRDDRTVATTSGPARFIKATGGVASAEQGGQTRRPRPPADLPVRTLPLWDDFQQGDYGRFWSYLAMRDREAALDTTLAPRGWGLVDGHGRCLVSADRILLQGDAALWQRLDAYYREWRTHGSPAPRDFSVEFVALEDEASDVCSHWAMRGQYYTRHFCVIGGAGVSGQ